VGVDQPREHDSAVGADHRSIREVAGDLGVGADGQDLAPGEGDGPVLEVTNRAHGQHVTAADDGARRPGGGFVGL
jgi:hypothetical protein